MKKKLLVCLGILGGFAALGLLAFLLVWNGVILLNGFAARQYPVKGVDVSAYQGEIDWEILSSQNISFAFIKATEGSTFVDERFAANWEAAQATDLAVGAYHFFSYDSAGSTQAENFIRTVTPHEGMLPPVIDVEFYGDKEKNPPRREDVERELGEMLRLLERHYRLKPILYATETTYDLYLTEGWEEYDIWIRDVIATPKLSHGRAWTFWQYTNRERFRGYSGEETYIDMNVFSGDEEAFLSYLEEHTYRTE